MAPTFVPKASRRYPDGSAADHRCGRVVISSVGHPCGYLRFFGPARVCPQGRAERALAGSGVRGVGPCLPGKEMTRFAVPSPREGRGFGGSAPLGSTLSCR